MGERFFALINGTDIFEKDFFDFHSYTDASAVVEKVDSWLEAKNSLDCVPAAKEESLRAENDGELPEQTFLCPEVCEPLDLEKYNGFYQVIGMNNCVYNLFITVVHDVETAERFKVGLIKEYSVGNVFTEEADNLRAALDTFVAYFSDRTIKVDEAEELIRNFLMAGGFDPYGGNGIYAPDFMVFTGNDVGDGEWTEF